MGDVSKGILIGVGVLGGVALGGIAIQAYLPPKSPLQKLAGQEGAVATGLVAGGVATWLFNGSNLGAGLALSAPISGALLIGAMVGIYAYAGKGE